MSSLFLQRGSRRSIPNAGSRRPCDVNRAGPREKPIEIPTAEVMTPPAMGAKAAVAILLDRASCIRRFARIAAARRRFLFYPATTNRSIAGIVSNRCAVSNSHGIRTIRIPSPRTSLENRVQSARDSLAITRDFGLSLGQTVQSGAIGSVVSFVVICRHVLPARIPSDRQRPVRASSTYAHTDSR